MFWMLVLFIGVALAFTKLGVLSVTVRLLGLALNVAILIAVVLAVVLIWKTVSRRFGRNSNV